MKTRLVIGIMSLIPIRLTGALGRYGRRILQGIYRPSQGLLHRIAMECRYLRMRRWTFSDVGKFWDSIVDYDDINDKAYSYFRRFVDGYKYSNIPENSYVLDVCSRTGNGTKFFWEKGRVRESVCADVSSEFQRLCAEDLKRNRVPFRLKPIDSLPLPFDDEEFDAILCFETVEHFCEQEDFIKELSRILKKDGQIILTTPNILWEPIHSFAAIFNLHHSEGPHRFIGRRKLLEYIRNAELDLAAEKTTVLLPGGPKPLIRLGEWMEGRIGERMMSILGLRRIFICRRKDH